MTASHFAHAIDRFAATAITAVLLISLPLSMVGFLAHSF